MITINLLPAEPRKGLASRLPKLPSLAIGFGVLSVLLIGGVGSRWYVLSREGTQLRSDIAQAEKELERLKSVIEEGSRFKRQKEDLERRLTLIELISRSQARPVYLHDTLVDMVPKDLWLSTIEEKENQLRLAGSAFSEQTVAEFMFNLIRSGRFKNVDLKVSRKDLVKAPRLVTFEVVCSFEV